MFQTETKHTVESLSTRVSHGELQKWPLLTSGLCSERHKLHIRFSRDKLKLALVDVKPLIAGDLYHRFDRNVFAGMFEESLLHIPDVLCDSSTKE